MVSEVCGARLTVRAWHADGVLGACGGRETLGGLALRPDCDRGYSLTGLGGAVKQDSCAFGAGMQDSCVWGGRMIL